MTQWDPEEPECVRCYTPLSLREHCEWSDVAELNVCDDCARLLLEEQHATIAFIAADERACCPEHVGFREYITKLKSDLAAAQAACKL